jgi:hypothetical protein
VHAFEARIPGLSHCRTVKRFKREVPGGEWSLAGCKLPLIREDLAIRRKYGNSAAFLGGKNRLMRTLGPQRMEKSL